eukprot:GHVT01062518.1.p1 GENE.GHVT01062518.1~~GHVT01062518.1.p1  ORF type:complete len:395 (-),score=6.70 GHVT01062518.1:194-1378(-)
MSTPKPRLLRFRRTDASPPIKSWLEDMLAKGYAEPCRGAHVFHVTPHFAVPKPDNPLKMRIVGDFRSLNSSVEPHSCAVPSIPELWLRTQQHDQTSVVDLEDGYYQVVIPRWARPYFGFRVGDHYYRYTRLPQGYVNSPKIFIDFVKLMAPKLMEDPAVEVYMDDVVGYGLSPEDLLDKVAKTGLAVNHGKTKTTTTPGGAKILGLQIENRHDEVVWTPSSKIVQRYEDNRRNLTGLVSSREGLMLCGALQFYRPFLPGLHAWVRPWYDWMKGAMRSTLERRRTCKLSLPKLHFEIRVPRGVPSRYIRTPPRKGLASLGKFVTGLPWGFSSQHGHRLGNELWVSIGRHTAYTRSLPGLRASGKILCRSGQIPYRYSVCTPITCSIIFVTTSVHY